MTITAPRCWKDVMDIIDNRQELELTDRELQQRRDEHERWLKMPKEEKDTYINQAKATVLASQPPKGPPQSDEEIEKEKAEEYARLRFCKILQRTGLPNVLEAIEIVWGLEALEERLSQREPKP